MCALGSRRPMERRVLSCSSQSSNVATQGSVQHALQLASTPCSCRTWARCLSVVGSVVCIVLVSNELVIAIQAVRAHCDVTLAHMFWQGHAQRGRGLLLALALQCHANGIGVWYTALQGICNGRSHLRAPMHIEQFLQLPCSASQRLTPFGCFVKQGLNLRHCMHQAVGVTVGTRGTLVLHQFLQMGLDFDLRALVPATPVGGQYLLAIQDAYLCEVSVHGETTLHMGVGDGIVVQVEANIRGLAGRHGPKLVATKRGRG